MKRILSIFCAVLISSVLLASCEMLDAMKEDLKSEITGTQSSQSKPESSDESEKASPKIEDYTDENGIVRFSGEDRSDLYFLKDLYVTDEISYYDIFSDVQKYLITRQYNQDTIYKGDIVFTVDGNKVQYSATVYGETKYQASATGHVEIDATYNGNFTEFTVEDFRTDVPDMFTSREMQSLGGE